jgi:hypothetical protein
MTPTKKPAVIGDGRLFLARRNPCGDYATQRLPIMKDGSAFERAV